MTKFPTKDQLIELRKAEEKVIGGQWIAGSWSGQCFDDHSHSREVCNYKYKANKGYGLITEYGGINLTITFDEPGVFDSEFIALSRNLCKPMLDLIDKLEQESIEREKTVKVWIQSEKQARDYAIKLQNKLETAEKALIVCTTYCGDTGHGDAAEQALAAIRGKQ